MELNKKKKKRNHCRSLQLIPESCCIVPSRSKQPTKPILPYKLIVHHPLDKSVSSVTLLTYPPKYSNQKTNKQTSKTPPQKNNNRGVIGPVFLIALDPLPKLKAKGELILASQAWEGEKS